MQLIAVSSKHACRRIARAQAGMRVPAVVAMVAAKDVVIVLPLRSPGPGLS